MPAPEPPSDEIMPVTLPEGPAEVFFSAGWKNGSSFQEVSTAGEAVTGGGAGAGIGAGDAGRAASGRAALALKNWVKPLPSPGGEKPLVTEGPDEGGGTGRGVSCTGRAGGV